MFVPDRTVKMLLVSIVALLVVIAGSRLLEPATAQNLPAATPVEAWFTEKITVLKLAKEDRIKQILPMDQSQAFIIQYDDRVEVYRLYNVDPELLRTRR